MRWLLVKWGKRQGQSMKFNIWELTWTSHWLRLSKKTECHQAPAPGARSAAMCPRQSAHSRTVGYAPWHWSHSQISSPGTSVAVREGYTSSLSNSKNMQEHLTWSLEFLLLIFQSVELQRCYKWHSQMRKNKCRLEWLPFLYQRVSCVLVNRLKRETRQS